MSGNRLPDYLDHMRQAVTDACGFVEGLAKEDFFEDKRTQQAVIMSLIIIGEAATKVMDEHAPGLPRLILKCNGAACAVCATASRTVISTSTSIWCGTPCRQRCQHYCNSCPPFVAVSTNNH
jgi:hypothetical protein